MVVEYTRYRIAKNRQSDFLEAYRRSQVDLRNSPHCVGYELSQCVEQPDHFVLRIEWVSVEEHLQGFRRGASFQNFFSLVQPFVSDIEEMQHYQLTDIAGRGAAPAKAAA